ncbi:hypothetical protein VTP01DRAFT_2739 [Rhizomucor pusillus]|uniref:uncharacterized protein n=1 Tax=Rhizomucor pusillus TaxID=4840 RepID=UPI003743A2C4
MHTYDRHERQDTTYLLISDKTGSGRSTSNFAAIFFWLLQEYAVGFLRVTRSRREAVQQQDHYTDIARLFVLRVTDDLTHELNAFANQSDATKSCLVLDGARLQAKNATHAARQAKKTSSPRKVRQAMGELYPGHQTRNYPAVGCLARHPDVTLAISPTRMLLPYSCTKLRLRPIQEPCLWNKLANALYRKIKQRNRGRDSTNTDIATRVDEYISSKMRCYCTKQSRGQPVDFLQRTPVVPVQDAARLDDDHEKAFRVVTCQNFNRVFRHDGDPADNLASITQYMLRFQERPRWFVRSSRRQRTASDRGTTVTSGFPGRPGERDITTSSGAPRRKRTASETETMVESSWSLQREKPESSSAPLNDPKGCAPNQKVGST